MLQRHLFFILLLLTYVEAMSFHDALETLQKHESIASLLFKIKASKAEANLRSSWGDPGFKIAAKNFPTQTLADDQTPMTGVEVGISQKVPLTTKYTSIKNAFNALSQVYHYESKDKRERLAKALWEIVILQRKIREERAILKETRRWIEKILKVSERLYATGKVSQQALLEIQIRKSEIERDLSNKNYELFQIDDKLNYLIGNTHIEEESIPWKILKRSSTVNVDYRELGLKEKLKVKEHALKASKLNYIPDVMLSLGYTKRADVDNNGDFLSASVSIKLPFSDEKSSKYDMALQEKFKAVKDYDNYKRVKHRDISLLSYEIKKLISELEILTNKMIKFATNSRKITSKSYSTGHSSYIELLQSELKLQKILMHKVMLEAKRDSKRVGLKYIKGEALDE